MNKLEKIDQGDLFRFLLTDVTPYETPLRFGFSRLHQAIRRNELSDEARLILLGPTTKSGPFEPYLYEVYVKDDKVRNLGIFHPHSFYKIRNIYEKHGLDVVSMCRKSDWSLRSPFGIAKTYRPQTLFFERQKITILEEEEVENSAVVQANFSSYFAYGPYTQIGRFYESREYLDFESRFKYCLKFDVASCFGNIYTHTIAWAIRTRSQAKREISSKNSFASRFDELMMSVNSAETHGILVGPEISRIFAEIIFQRIDSDAEALCLDVGLLNEIDFSVRRYVDDYFLFFNSEETANIVKKSIERCLSIYKLCLNEAKQELIKRPFETKISVAKGEIRNVLRNYFTKSTNEPHASSVLLEIRRTIASCDVSYSECGVWIMTRLYSEVQNLILSLSSSVCRQVLEYSYRVLQDSIEAGFFIMKVEPKYRISIILLKLIARTKFFQNRNTVIGGEATIDCVGREFRRMIKDLNTEKKVPFEIVCLMAALSESERFHPIPLDIINSRFLSDLSMDNYSYFEIIALLNCLKPTHFYKNQIEQLLRCILTKAEAIPEYQLINDTESFMLAIEIVANPLFGMVKRKSFAERIHKGFGINLSRDQKVAFLNEMEVLMPFYDRSENLSLEQQIAKKELSFTY